MTDELARLLDEGDRVFGGVIRTEWVRPHLSVVNLDRDAIVRAIKYFTEDPDRCDMQDREEEGSSPGGDVRTSACAEDTGVVTHDRLF